MAILESAITPKIVTDSRRAIYPNLGRVWLLREEPVGELKPSLLLTKTLSLSKSSVSAETA